MISIRTMPPIVDAGIIENIDNSRIQIKALLVDSGQKHSNSSREWPGDPYKAAKGYTNTGHHTARHLDLTSSSFMFPR
jgi:hypothetical protein